jgi:ribosomal small subunit protein bTHX
LRVFSYFCKKFVKLKKYYNMGKGDMKTAKGKRVKGSYGISRPRKKAKPNTTATAETKK